MAKERSNKSTYPSRYGGGHVTIQQYITEYLCENIARSRGQELPQKFWENEDWAKFYKMQITLLNRNLSEYHPRAIVKALKDFRCKKVNSFAGFFKVKHWQKVLEEMHFKCLEEDRRDNELKEHKAPDATKDVPRQPVGKQSITSKLRELDNGQREER